MGKGERERERERLKQERLEAEQAASKSGRNRLFFGYGIAAVVVIAIIVGVFVAAGGGDDEAQGDSHINLNEASGSTNGVKPDNRVGTTPPPVQETDLKVAARKAGCNLKLELKDEGATHLPVESPEPGYETNPPTSGNHVEPPFQQADGAYAEEPSPLNLVHTLEHGRMEIQYSPDLPEADQLELKGLYDTMYGATLLFPNRRMPYAVAATTWTNLIGCPTYKGAATLDAIRAFGKETWSKYGGEPAELFEFTGPTPAEPDEPSA
jgi:Protein of unknown function (DUF3105)